MRTTVTRLLAPPPSRACADGLGYCPRLDALAPLNSRIRGPEPGFATYAVRFGARGPCDTGFCLLGPAVCHVTCPAVRVVVCASP